MKSSLECVLHGCREELYRQLGRARLAAPNVNDQLVHHSRHREHENEGPSRRNVRDEIDMMYDFYLGGR